MEDLTDCLDLLEEFYQEENITTTRSQMTLPLLELLDGLHGVVLLGYVGASVGGLAIISTLMGVEQGGKVGELTDLYVPPSHRSQGLGGRLLAASEDWARGSGCVALQLAVTAPGRARGMMEFYAKRAFSETDRTLFFKPLPTE